MRVDSFCNNPPTNDNARFGKAGWIVKPNVNNQIGVAAELACG